MPVYLDEPHGLVFASRIVCTVSIIINILAAYLVLTRSTTLRIYSWFLFNYLLTSCFFDCYLHLLMSPVVLFPYTAGYTTGPLRHVLQMPAHAQMYIIMCQTNSSVLTFYWRLQVAQLPGSRWRFRRRTNILIITLLYTATILPAIVAALGRTDRASLINYLVSRGDRQGLKLLDELNTDMYFAELFPLMHISIAMEMSYIVFAIFVSLFMAARTWYQLTSVTALSSAQNEKSRRTQIAFLRCLLLQIGLPLALLAFPISTMMLTVLFSWDIQGNTRPFVNAVSDVNHWVLALTSLHSPLASIIVLTTTAPYRQAINEWLVECFRYFLHYNKQTLNSAIANSSTTAFQGTA